VQKVLVLSRLVLNWNENQNHEQNGKEENYKKIVAVWLVPDTSMTSNQIANEGFIWCCTIYLIVLLPEYQSEGILGYAYLFFFNLN
jgi:hypothetical protein